MTHVGDLASRQCGLSELKKRLDYAALGEEAEPADDDEGGDEEAGEKGKGEKNGGGLFGRKKG